MRSDAAAPVAVVGGGFSGAMTAVHLARRGLEVRLFEGRTETGRGIAYGTPDPVHLLNVPAGRMSALEDSPDHFRAALSLDPGAFASRHDYGSYVRDIVARQEGVTVERADVQGLTRDGDDWHLKLADGRAFAASAVVLALGNEPPKVPDGWSGLPVIANPWSEEARQAISGLSGESGDVLLIGTGLTMIDVALSLQAADFRGRVLAFSRRGLLPRAHAAHDPAPVTLANLPQGRVLPLFRWLRRRSSEVGYRAAVDSLRPHTAALWQGWPVEERRRFLRHARPWWDVHRHRIAPELGQRLESLLESGWLEVAAARLQARDGDTLRLAGRHGERLIVPRLIINCTGPLGDVRLTSNPLLRQILEQGIVSTDPLGLGLATDRNDRAAPRLWALGPLTKGMYWEMTAVPDIRKQAERVAGAIAKELTSHG